MRLDPVQRWSRIVEQIDSMLRVEPYASMSQEQWRIFSEGIVAALASEEMRLIASEALGLPYDASQAAWAHGAIRKAVLMRVASVRGAKGLLPDPPHAPER